MLIKQGPRIVEYAKATGLTIEEALEFVNTFINDPIPEHKKEWPTHESRLKSIKEYMLWVIDYEKELTRSSGINERIKESIENGKLSNV